MISHHHGLIFVHVPKCAGMTIELALGGLPVPQRPEQHFTSHQYARYHPELWRSLHRFTVVRDPITRCLSYTRFFRRWDAVWRKHLSDVPDDVLLRDLLMSPNLMTTHNPSRMLTGDEEVLKVEELATTWPAFAKRFGLPHTLPHRNASPRATQRDAVSPATQLMIAARFPDDFERFGYALPSVQLEELTPAEQGSVLWAQLRRWATDASDSRGQLNEHARPALSAWVDSLPSNSWRERWEQAEAKLPVPWESPTALVFWSEQIHDEVRRSLGLAPWTPWHPGKSG